MAVNENKNAFQQAVEKRFVELVPEKLRYEKIVNRTPSGQESEVKFWFTSEEHADCDTYKQAMVVGSELEFMLNTSKNDYAKLIDMLVKYDLYGDIQKPSNFQPDNYILNTSEVPEDWKVAQKFYAKVFRILFLENSSIFVAGQSDSDSTIGMHGGPELRISPLTLGALPYFKEDFEKNIKLAMKLFNVLAEDNSTSLHFHINLAAIGKTNKEVVEQLSNLIKFAYYHRDWCIEFFGRQGPSQELSDMLYMIGDPLNELSEKGQLRKLQTALRNFSNLYNKNNAIRKEDKTVATTSDDRVKGLFNITVNDKFPTAEVRWAAMTNSPTKLSALYEFFFAFFDWSREKNRNEDSLSNNEFFAYVENKHTVYENLHVYLPKKEKSSIELPDIEPIFSEPESETIPVDIKPFVPVILATTGIEAPVGIDEELATCFLCNETVPKDFMLYIEEEDKWQCDDCADKEFNEIFSAI